MRMIKKLVCQLDDEIKGAERYAEKYMEAKVNGENEKKDMYFSMAQDELKHAMNIHSLTVDEIEKVRKVYTPPQDMIEKWNKEHELYVNKVAAIKSMLQV